MMRRSTTRFGTVLACGAALALLGSACATTDEEAAPAPTGSEFDQGHTQDKSPEMKKTAVKLEPVYFALDRSDLSEEARGLLQGEAEAIRFAKGEVTVQGYTDDRGTWEYNLALGDRRANSVKKYLVNLGVPSPKMQTVSYGEADPAVQGHNESAWRWNRRVTFLVD